MQQNCLPVTQLGPMNTDLPVQVLVPIATIIAALITAAIAFVNLTLSKEQKTSEFRQQWIDSLREDLSQFIGAARAFARAVEIVNTFGPNYKDKLPLLLSEDKVSDLRYQATETLCRIKLRLNALEPEHQELLRLLDRAVAEQNKMLANGTGIEDTLKAIDTATEYARPILKKEWERVKAGELPFRVVRNWVAPAVVILCLVFAFLVLRSNHGA